jgi:hypothetical protein
MKERARARQARMALTVLPAWQARQWACAAAAAAAVILVCLGSWALWHPRELPVVRTVTKPLQPDPFVASLVQRDLRLAVAQTTAERLEALTDLSGDLFQETRLVVRGARAEDLHQLALLYQKVVEEGIVHVAQAPSLRTSDRRQVLGPIADRLDQTARQADKLATFAPRDAATALHAISAAARGAQTKLRELVATLPIRFFPVRSAVAVATLVLLIEVEDPSLPPDSSYVWQQLTRNRSLIQTLVIGGLVLATEEDPLQRANHCNGLARQLVDEIQQAADREDAGRAAELGGHLHDLLQGGLVRNLNTVRDQTPASSTRFKVLREVSEEAQRVTEPLEKRFHTISKTDPSELRRVLQSIHDARAEVAELLTSRTMNSGEP